MSLNKIYAFIIVASFVISTKAYWDEASYPDPTSLRGFEKCGMLQRSYLCDVDEVLTEKERFELNQLLNEFPNKTSDDSAETPCKRKGTTLAIAIVKSLSSEMNRQRLSYFAVDLHKKWTLDRECRKSALILLPANSWSDISRDFHYEAPVFFDEFNYYFFKEQEYFGNGSFFIALKNVVKGLQTAILQKRFMYRPNDEVQNELLKKFASIIMEKHLKQETGNFNNFTQMSAALEMLNSTNEVDTSQTDFLDTFDFLGLPKRIVYWILFFLQILAAVLLFLFISWIIRYCQHRKSTYYTSSGTTTPSGTTSVTKSHLDSQMAGHNNAEFHHSAVLLSPSEHVDQV